RRACAGGPAPRSGHSDAPSPARRAAVPASRRERARAGVGAARERRALRHRGRRGADARDPGAHARGRGAARAAGGGCGEAGPRRAAARRAGAERRGRAGRRDRRGDEDGERAEGGRRRRRRACGRRRGAGGREGRHHDRVRGGGGVSERRHVRSGGEPIQPVYGPEDVELDPQSDLGRPGAFPFTRGVYETMYRGRLWTMRQYAGFGTAAETNRRYHYLLDHGQTGLSVAFDLPTQMGYDSDHPMAQGEVGRVGVAIASLDDMRVLFDGIPLEDVSVSMTINATAAILLAFYVALADERGVPRDRLAGTIQNDVLKEYIARGTYIYPVEPSLRLVTDTFAFCAAEVPRWNPISISGYHIREAGATAVQEIAFTFANALEYVNRARTAGLDLNTFAPRLSFFFAAHNQLFEEVAKFRAARRLWATLMRERYGAGADASRLRFHTQTGGVTLTAQQPLNNVVRVTVQALAAVLGGTQSLHTNAYDEALALPTEESVRLALRTQQILAAESGVADTADRMST